MVSEVMITPATLHSWLTVGYGYDDFGHNRMVILDIDTQAGYAAGHIPGAYLLADNETGLWAIRTDGISELSLQVPNLSQIDAIIRNVNIDEGSVIVLTGRDLTVVARAYFTFRYWGFCREQLKVLNGSKSTYAAAGFSLERTFPPKPVPGRFSVCKLHPGSSVSRIRATFLEIFSIAKKTTSGTIIIDSRSPVEFMGKNDIEPGTSGQNQSVASAGHIRNAVNLAAQTLHQEDDPRKPLRSKDELLLLMKSAGLEKSTVALAYTGQDFRSAVVFLALDAVLRWPVKIYDGGWLQWKQMMSISYGDSLKVNSLWSMNTKEQNELILLMREEKSNTRGYNKSGITQIDNAVWINDLDSASCAASENNPQDLIRAPGYGH